MTRSVPRGIARKSGRAWGCPPRWIGRASLLALGCNPTPPSETLPNACQNESLGALRDASLTFRVDSTWNGSGQLQPGPVASCDRGASVHRAFRVARAALKSIPAPFRPGSVTVHWAPQKSYTPLALGRRLWARWQGQVDKEQVHGLEFDVQRGELLASAAEHSRSEWLHEFAHVASRGPRPSRLVSRRLLASLDEGVADYYAAVVEGNPKLSNDRDLTHPPELRGSEFAALPLPWAAFDPHRHGSTIASQLWQQQDKPSSLLQDLLTALATPRDWAGVRDTPAGALGAVLESCPQPSRAQLRRALEAWLPEELRAFETAPLHISHR